MTQELTQQYLKECLDYNPDTGIFTRKTRPDLKILGTKRNGYLLIRVNRKLYSQHRLAWFYIHGYMPENYIDHINGIKSDNRISNLRQATGSENNQNMKQPSKNNKLGFLGVGFSKRNKAFTARITINYKSTFIGYFKTPQEAHNAYLQAKRQLHPYGTL